MEDQDTTLANSKPNLTPVPTGYLNRDQFAAFQGCKPEDYEVPEIGGKIKIRGLTLQERQDVKREATVAGELDSDKFDLGFVQVGMIEPKLDAGILLGLPSGIFDRLEAKMLELSGFGAQSLEQAKKDSLATEN